MKRILIICEGKTERLFSQQILARYLYDHFGIAIDPIDMQGICKWGRLSRQITTSIKKSRNCIVTTLIDYYGIQGMHGFPQWASACNLSDPIKRIECLERGMCESVIHHCFLPYIQLHEFEALLFYSMEKFYEVFKREEIRGIDRLQQIIERFPNPELIWLSDVRPTEAHPSAILKAYIPSYDKVLHVIPLARAIGIEAIRQKAPRFKCWLDRLVQMAQA